MAWMTPRSVKISSASWTRCTDGARGTRGLVPRTGDRPWLAAPRRPARYADGRARSLCCWTVLGLLAACGPLHAQSTPFGATVALTSQLVDRGLAITPATPVLQGEVRWNSPAGWSAGMAAASELRSPRLAEGMLHVGRSWTLSGDWQAQTSLLYYDAPRRGRARPYRRAEADMAWIYRDVLSLNLAVLRPLGIRHARTNPAAEANLRWPLTRHLSLLAGLGVARFQHGPYGYASYGRYDDDVRSSYYDYGQAGLAWTAGRWHVEIDRIVSAGAPPSRRGTDGLSPWLASVSWSF